MSNKKVAIEYCNSWGFRGPAGKLQQVLQQAFPQSKIEVKPAANKTNRIDVKLIDGEKTEVVWSDGKKNTESNHEAIATKLKPCLWCFNEQWVLVANENGL